MAAFSDCWNASAPNTGGSACAGRRRPRPVDCTSTAAAPPVAADRATIGGRAKSSRGSAEVWEVCDDERGFGLALAQWRRAGEVRVADLLRGAGGAAAPTPSRRCRTRAARAVLPAEPKALVAPAVPVAPAFPVAPAARVEKRREFAPPPPTPRTGVTKHVAKVRTPRNSKKLLLLIALVAVGLGGALVPAFFHARVEIRRSALATDLRFLNGASKRFRDQHSGKVPGIDEDSNVDEERLVRQLTLPTDARGQVLPGGPFGPYLKAGIPPNPWNGSSDVKIVSTAALPPIDGSTGWVFHVPTGQFVRTLAAARLAADVCGVPTVLVARTGPADRSSPATSTNRSSLWIEHFPPEDARRELLRRASKATGTAPQDDRTGVVLVVREVDSCSRRSWPSHTARWTCSP